MLESILNYFHSWCPHTTPMCCRKPWQHGLNASPYIMREQREKWEEKCEFYIFAVNKVWMQAGLSIINAFSMHHMCVWIKTAFKMVVVSSIYCKYLHSPSGMNQNGQNEPQEHSSGAKPRRLTVAYGFFGTSSAILITCLNCYFIIKL